MSARGESSGDGAGRGPRGGPAEDLGGGLGRRLDGKPQAGAREVGWEPGRVARDPRRAAHWRHRGASADAPRAPTPARQRLTLGGMGVWLNGQVIWGASKSFWISGQSVWVLQLRQFGSLGFCPMFRIAHFPRRLPRDPLCQGRAGMDRPQGHASPVTRAQKPWASRLLVGLPAGGLRWGQKWGEVNLPAAWIPVAALGTEIDGGWPVSPDPQT